MQLYYNELKSHSRKLTFQESSKKTWNNFDDAILQYSKSLNRISSASSMSFVHKERQSSLDSAISHRMRNIRQIQHINCWLEKSDITYTYINVHCTFVQLFPLLNKCFVRAIENHETVWLPEPKKDQKERFFCKQWMCNNHGKLS